MKSIRELNLSEIDSVTGAGTEHSVYRWLTGNSGYGASNLQRATTLSRAGGLVGAAFLGGFAAGTWINNQTGVGQAIGGAIFDALN